MASRSGAGSTLRLAGISFAFWSAVGVVFTLSSLSHGVPWRTALLGSLAEWWSWGLLTPVVLAVARGLRPARARNRAAWFAGHLAAGAALAYVETYVETALLAATGTGAWALLGGRALAVSALGSMTWNLIVYGLIVGVAEANVANRRALSAELRMERLERNFSEARLAALRLQLDPHFLFNALNTISAQVVREPRLARTMIEHLGDLLRLSLDPQSRNEWALGDELALLAHYVAIQKIRFGDQFRFEIDVPDDLMDAEVPSLFLQPLVENAVRHGISSRASGGAVAIVARAARGELTIRVSDDGVGLPAGWTLAGNRGLGLSITRERIEGLYPAGRAHFCVRPAPGGGAEALVALPLRAVAQASVHAVA